ELYRLEQIFNRSLLNVPYVQLWGTYLDYVRRRNNLTNDTSGQARSIITSAYVFALQKIGIDKDSAQIWVDYIQFLRTAPGIIGGTTWQDQQKMDTLRKAYQRAVIVPMQALNTLWKEYDQFEMGLNKLTGRRFLQERSPAYMTARSSYTELQNITQDLVRTTLPRLPPLPGCEGYEKFQKQLAIWRRWIQWEIDDPLVFKEEDSDAYKARVLYVYRQAIMAMRFVPELWFEAATFCFDNGLESEGDEFLKEGIEANPESCLLAFKRADRLEVTSTDEHDTRRRGAKVREAYDKVLDALYELIAKARTQEATAVAAVEEKFANMPDEDVDQPIEQGSNNEDDDNEGETPEVKTKESMKKAEIDAVKAASGARITQLSKTVSFAWIALMRAMRRIQGKGRPGEMAGSRQVFADARKRGRITSDVYIASALLEHHCYKDPAATKIFERGSKLFPEDENFALEYLKHLIDINDMTNARAVFETSTRRLTANPKTVHKSKVLYRFMHEHESRYGDMVQILSIESRMRELFPEDPILERFASRYSGPSFDLMNIHLALSPMQTLPPTRRAEPTSSREPSVEILEGGPRYLTGSPGRAGDSPSKRPYPGDYDLDDYSRPRKYQRAESPLKGAAGRRVDQKQRQFAHSAQPSLSGLSAAVNPLAGASASGSRGTAAPPPPMAPQPLPKDIMFLLSIIPGAKTYDATRFSPEKMVALLRSLDIPSSVRDLRLPPGVQGGGDIMGMGMAGK
ncbi:mRNA 3'-end-processing protein rna14, partial [Ascosphaera atra]